MGLIAAGGSRVVLEAHAGSLVLQLGQVERDQMDVTQEDEDVTQEDEDVTQEDEDVTQEDEAQHYVHTRWLQEGTRQPLLVSLRITVQIITFLWLGNS